MAPEEEERVQWLLERIQVEEDQEKFTELCRELNELLEEKQNRLTEKQETPSRTDPQSEQ